jgi:hypothetical protein
VEVSGVGTIRMEFRRDSERFFIDPPDPKVLLLGYGATRLLPKAVGRASSDQRAIRILNLFDPTAPLADVESWLLNPEMVSDEQLERFGDDLARLLMLEDDTRIHRDNGHVELEYKGSRKVLRDMSDGFQSIIALAGDISIGVRDWWDGLREAEGIVLLDEIEVHLHPTWKISIVERLRETCPMLSFVVTTHDPLCLKGLRPEEIIVLRRSPENEVEVVTDIPRIDHLRSDQLLSSFLFNLRSTRGSGTAVAIARYSTLLGKEGRNPGEEAELQRLRESLQQELSSGGDAHAAEDRGADPHGHVAGVVAGGGQPGTPGDPEAAQRVAAPLGAGAGMIKLQFQEPHAPEWEAWRQEVAAELAALQAHGPPYQVKDSLYKKQRETIFACYLNKCAYCEGHYRLTAKEGDVEHFRPKGRVRGGTGGS